MYIKRYTMAAMFLIIITGWYVYAFVTHDGMSLAFFGINLPAVPIALLVVIPMIVLYLGSVFHMGFYSFLGGMKLRKYEKDYNKILKAIKDALLLKEDRNNEYKTPRYKLMGKIVDNSKIFPNTEALLNLDNEELREVIQLIHRIKNGEVVTFKKLNLPANNELVVQNNMNRYRNGDLSAEEILINAKNHDESFVKRVFVDFVQIAEGKKIVQYYKEFITKEALMKIIDRISNEKNQVDISADTLVEMISAIDLDKDEFIYISKALKGMMPEDRLKIFEILSEKNEDAMEAYLYTAFDLEMIELADEILESASPDEYQNFRAYKALKECNQNYSIDLFIK